MLPFAPDGLWNIDFYREDVFTLSLGVVVVCFIGLFVLFCFYSKESLFSGSSSCPDRGANA